MIPLHVVPIKMRHRKNNVNKILHGNRRETLRFIYKDKMLNRAAPTTKTYSIHQAEGCTVKTNACNSFFAWKHTKNFIHVREN